MRPQHIFAVYFSATGNTRKACTAAARELAQRAGTVFDTIDITAPSCRVKPQRFGPDDIVIVGVPVYAGRVPGILLPWFEERLAGNGACAVPLVTYGNRAYDGALYELDALLTGAGFHTLAAAAVPAQHSFSADIAPGRPNAEDLAGLRAFAGQIYIKYNTLSDSVPAPLSVPGHEMYEKSLAQPVPGAAIAPPMADPKLCEGCCMCAVLCPTGAIPRSDPLITTGNCIHCQACVTRCPRKARSIDDDGYRVLVKKLEELCQNRKEQEFFL